MKSLLAVAILSLAFTACGKDAATTGSSTTAVTTDCANAPVVGVWNGTIRGNADTLTFAANCHGTSTYCGTTFTYPPVTANPGNVLMTVTSNNGRTGCFGVGDHNCVYQVTNNQLQFSCDGLGATYTR